MLQRLVQWWRHGSATVLTYPPPANGVACLSCAAMTPADCGRVAGWVASGNCKAAVVDCSVFDPDRMSVLLAAVPVNKIVMWYPAPAPKPAPKLTSPCAGS